MMTALRQIYTQPDTDRGCDLIAELVYDLNDIITSTGQAIDINNPRIWDKHLHRYHNEHWADMLAAMSGLREIRPDLFEPFHEDALLAAQTALAQGGARALDQRKNKRTAWKMIMAMREIMNKINGVNIPNRDHAMRRRPGADFGDLFEIE